MIKAGDTIPSVPVKLVDANGVTDTTSTAVLGTGRVVFFAVPGAFTPTCHVNHLPGFIANADKLHAAGVDRIVCAAANDHHVVKAWAEATGALGKIDFIADGNAALAKAWAWTRISRVPAWGRGSRAAPCSSPMASSTPYSSRMRRVSRLPAPPQSSWRSKRTRSSTL